MGNQQSQINYQAQKRQRNNNQPVKPSNSIQKQEIIDLISDSQHEEDYKQENQQTHQKEVLDQPQNHQSLDEIILKKILQKTKMYNTQEKLYKDESDQQKQVQVQVVSNSYDRVPDNFIYNQRKSIENEDNKEQKDFFMAQQENLRNKIQNQKSQSRDQNQVSQNYSNKSIAQKKIRWEAYSLSQSQLKKIHDWQKQNKNVPVKKLKNQMKMDFERWSESSASSDQMVDEADYILIGQSQESQMADQFEYSEDKQDLNAKVKVQDTVQKKVKIQYLQKTPEQLGIFQWNQIQDKKQFKLNQEQKLLLNFQRQVKQKGFVNESPYFEKNQQKRYLKSLDLFVYGMQYDIFPDVQYIQSYQDFIKVKVKQIRPNVGHKYNPNVYPKIVSDMLPEFSDPTEKHDERAHKKKIKQAPWTNYMINENLDEIKKFEEKQKENADYKERQFQKMEKQQFQKKQGSNQLNEMNFEPVDWENQNQPNRSLRSKDQQIQPSLIDYSNNPYANFRLQFWIQDILLGYSNFIENVSVKTKNYPDIINKSFESLDFLLSKGILQVQLIKISQSSFKNYQQDQIYLNTRAGSNPQNIDILMRKKHADYELSMPLSFNIIKYYNYVCTQKLNRSSMQPSYQAFGQNQEKNLQQLLMKEKKEVLKYETIFSEVYDHLKNVLSMTNKSKNQQAIKKQIIYKRNVLQDKDSQEDEEDCEQSEDSYDIECKKLNYNAKNKFPDNQLSKEQLQSLFESGKWFSLNSSKVKPQKPSTYFRGQLKFYQQLTLGWMLYRENCPVQYKLDRPIRHYDWYNIQRVSQHLYKSEKTKQILSFLPYWEKNVKGGMLCDEMGLGKTVMSLALIDTHVRREKRNPQTQAGTLVIVPTTVLLQWQAKVNEFLPHLSYTIVSKGKDLDKKQILRSQIVLTTFGIVRAQRKLDQTYQFDDKVTNLYSFDWFRIIVDEADNLRNAKTHSAKGINELRSNYVWLLTGTPIQNRLSDLESYFQLLNYDNHGFQKGFPRKGFIKSDKELMLIKQSLKDILVRRKKDSTDEFGNPLLLLKQYKWIYKKFKLNEADQKIYYMIASRIVKDIDKIIAADRKPGQWDQKMVGLTDKMQSKFDNIEHVFGQIMKLRQFCCHPQLVYTKSTYIKYEKFPKHFKHFCENGYDFHTFKQYNSSRRTQMKQIMKRIFLTQNQIQRQTYKQKVLEKIMNKQNLICVCCNQVIKSGVLVACLHLYCQDCLKDQWLNQPKKEEFFTIQGKKHRRRYIQCADCKQKIYQRQTLQLPRYNRFNKDIQEIKPNEKILELIDLIQKTDKNEKIVVFTHFIGMIQILQHILNKKQISAITLMGNHTIQERNSRINAFKTKENIKVFVISTKCGYAGLNLQIANKMFFMEPWWNPAVQDQALGRLHRFGQQNEVEATRFIIQGSIEQIINLMGQEKKMISDFILDSDSFKKRKKKVQILKVFRKILNEKIHDYYIKK